MSHVIKYVIYVKIAPFDNVTQYLSIKKDKFYLMNDKRSKSCLKFDTLEQADSYIHDNKDFFIERKWIYEVGCKPYKFKE